MKKAILVAILIVLVLTAVPASAFAASGTLAAENISTNPQYAVLTLVQPDSPNQPIGVVISGSYFGADITVRVEIYSQPTCDLNFFLGSDGLTQQQRQTQAEMLALAAEINDFINQVDALANTQYDGRTLQSGATLPVSDIYRYNTATQGTVLEIDQKTYEMLQIAKEMYLATDGAFNPAVYRLVDLWGFSSRIYSDFRFGQPYDRPVTPKEFFSSGYPLPQDKYVQAFSKAEFLDFSDASVTLSTTEIDGTTHYYVTKNVQPVEVFDDATQQNVAYNQWLDLGGIAKGYVVDTIKQMLEARGLQRYYVDAGKSSSVFGYNTDGGPTQLFMVNSMDPNSIMYPVALLGFDVGKCSVSTSGQYIRKYTYNGVEYSHIIDGAKGAPAQTGVKAVMVVVPEDDTLWAGRADCLTTALTVMGINKITKFINEYLQPRNISVVAQYETVRGTKQLVTNVEQSKINYRSDSFDDFGWALEKVPAKDGDGNVIPDQTEFAYNPNAHGQTKKNSNKVWIIVLATIAGAAVVGLIVYYCVRGRKKTLQKVQQAKRDKPFKPADILPYLAVVLVIVVLFMVFMGGDKTDKTGIFANKKGDSSKQQDVSFIKIIDLKTEEEYFLYNVAMGRWEINENNSAGWDIQVKQVSDGLEVSFTRSDGHFNVAKITYGNKISVKMINSECGHAQECVRTFGTIDKAGGVIICTPNQLKLATE